ncbi:radical SAM protein [Spirochaetia bacterium]|nr:radical SAM protein [Spirochaetia bacterium]
MTGINYFYDDCRLCPRNCGVNRAGGEKGFCGETDELRIALAGIHYGEEPPVTGGNGSGTVFFSGCNLACVFCQNYQISHNGLGRVVSTEEFVDICLALQKNSAENINLVTGSHAAPAIIKGIIQARRAGLTIPCLWNSSGYETTETIGRLDGIIDMYLPDLKTLDEKIAHNFFNAPDYPLYAAQAVRKMIGTGKPVIVRHLVLPEYLESTKKVLQWFAANKKQNVQLSLMTQYTPVKGARLCAGNSEPDRFVNDDEYKTVLQWLEDFEIEDGFYQELETGDGWLPDFTACAAEVFPKKLCRTVWHYGEGFAGYKKLT